MRCLLTYTLTKSLKDIIYTLKNNYTFKKNPTKSSSTVPNQNNSCPFHGSLHACNTPKKKSNREFFLIKLIKILKKSSQTKKIKLNRFCYKKPNQTETSRFEPVSVFLKIIWFVYFF